VFGMMEKEKKKNYENQLIINSSLFIGFPSFIFSLFSIKSNLNTALEIMK
jgi:hypothetical protein